MRLQWTHNFDITLTDDQLKGIICEMIENGISVDNGADIESYIKNNVLPSHVNEALENHGDAGERITMAVSVQSKFDSITGA